VREALLAGLERKLVLVTGVHGFLGANTAALAHRLGLSVVGIDLPGSTLLCRRMLASLACEGVVLDEADLTDPASWLAILRRWRPDVVLHLAGQTARGQDSAEWPRCLDSNLGTTIALLTALATSTVNDRPVLIYPGTQMEYGLAPMPWGEESVCRPHNAYAASKLASTVLVTSGIRTGLLKACVTRFALVFGPAQHPTMFVPELIVSALRGDNFKMTEGLQERRFVFVEEAAGLMLKVAARLLGAEPVCPILNMPALKPTSMRNLAALILGVMGHPVSVELGALPAREGEPLRAWPDDHLAETIGLTASAALEESLGKTIAWYRQNAWFYA